MPAIFLDDENLGAAIAEIARGADLRCAVAFWGAGAVEHLFPAGEVPGDARVICDLSMGSSNPDELRAMGAPTNRRLKHLAGLHAKVYISRRGAIICSANASNNGIGFRDVAGLVEAGVLLVPETSGYAKAVAWFKRIWRRSAPVDPATLAKATEAWDRRPRWSISRAFPIAEGPPSLLRTVAANPSRYRGIGFVFTNGRADEEERDEAATALQRQDDLRAEKLLGRAERRKLNNWNVGDLFTGWSEQDLDAWPRRFVCIHRPRARASYWFYQRAHEIVLGEDRGVVFAERPRGLRAELGFEHGREAMLATDTPLLERLFAHCEEQGHWLCEDGERLARLIEQVGADERA